MLLLLSCAAEETKVAEATSTQQTTPLQPELPAISEAFVGVDNLRLRAEPGQQGQEIARLPISTMVVPTGKQSDFVSKITLRGIPYNEPWFEIEAGQLKGWVFGGALDIDPNTSDLNQKLYFNRLKYLSPKHFTALSSFMTAVKEIKSSDDFLKAFKMGQAVKVDFNSDLEKKISLNGDRPQLMWLDTGLRGWRSILVAEGTRLQMTADYSEWAAIAKKTPNAADDSFVEFLDAVNGTEHVERLFPNYFLQTWDYGGSSSFGEGIHIKLLKQAEILYADQTAFSPLIKAEAEKIVLDILNPENSYWNPLGAIDSELFEIISGTWTVISTEEIAKLEKRKAAFKDYSKNGIKINEKAN